MGLRSFLALGLGLLVACGGSSTASTTPAGGAADPSKTGWQPPPLPTDGAIGALGLNGPDKPWNDMTYEEKEWYMIGKVHPLMRQVFQTLDAAKYEGLKFECEPCHGPDPKAKKYKMPSDHLSPVPPFDSKEYADMRGARIVKFMEQRVTPVMSSIMGMPIYDPKTKEGYSCYSCHPQQK
jgi:hypothetical protein